MHRVDGAELTKVLNLSTGEIQIFTCSAEEAVAAAHAVSVGRAGDVSRAVDLFRDQIKHGGSTVACGDFGALNELSKQKLIERKLQRAMELSSGVDDDVTVVYDYANDRFVRERPSADADQGMVPAL
jgi:hypothetical protein